MKFSEIKYERPDIETVKKEILKYAEEMKNADSYTAAKGAFLREDSLKRHVETLITIASIRHDINTKDEFYDAETVFWDHTSPDLQGAAQEFTNAMLASPYRKQLEEEFGNVVFLNAELQTKSFSPEIIPLLQEENKWSTKYSDLIASAEIPFEGKTYTLSQLNLYMNDTDDERRLAAWKAAGGWFKEKQPELDEIYDNLVRLRNEMAVKLGYENYIPMGYYRMERNSYTKEDVEKFRDAVIKYVVPAADLTYRQQAERLGREYPMNSADVQLGFRSGNPKPAGTPDDIVNAGSKFYNELSPETAKFFQTMRDNELMDLLSTEGKRGGGYCTGLYDYEVPFIFANFNGTQHDVEVITHEAGHAFAAWMNADRVPMETIWPSMEGCEVHSMSMEFFAEDWAEDFFGEDARKYRYSHLAGALQFIPYGTMVDHFQHEVYEHPEMTPRQRHETWKRLMGIYMPWIKLDGEIPVFGEGEHWQRQLHIYTSPFYYIDYCLAQTVALEFWAMIREDREKAWEYYMTYTRQGGAKVFTELLKGAGLKSPFEEETLKEVCEKASAFLRNYDLSGIY